MRKILFATEFSDHSATVFKYAADLALFFDMPLLVLHAFYNPKLELESDKVREDKMDEIREQISSFIQKHVPETHRDIAIEPVPKIGIPAKTILQTAEDEDVTILVLGMTGRNDVAGKFVGRTSLSVLASADCPVLLVPSNAVFAGIDEIIFTTNFEFRDLGALHMLQEWIKVFRSPVHCLHVVEKKGNVAKATKNLQILKDTFKHNSRIKFHLVVGNLETELEKFAVEKKADVVVMISHKRSYPARWLKRSRAIKIAYDLPFPFLVIKDNAYENEEWSFDWSEFLS